MKNKFVLIVLLCLASSFTALAQKSKSDSINLAKKALEQQNQQKAAEGKALKAAADKLEKAKKDSLSAITQAQKQAADKSKKDAEAQRVTAEKVRKDSLAAVAKALRSSSKKVKANNVASVSTPTIPGDSTKVSGKKTGKVKGEKQKSAKQLRKEAFNADPVNFDEKKIAAMRFNIDKSKIAPRPDVSFSGAKPYPQLEPNTHNIKFFHRYWRDIDLLDPNNMKFGSHHAVLISSVLSSIKKKEITAYSPVGGTPENPTGDAFVQPIKYRDMMAAFPDSTFVDSIDKVTGNNIGGKYVATPFTPEKVTGYRIKEDVFYDKVRAVMVTRIIGVAPLIKITASSGEVLNIQPLCWIKFKDFRKILVTIDVDPTKKIGTTLDDIFLQRKFYSRIVEESNPEGLRIKDYKTELAAQQAESDRLERKVAKFKQGSWTYTTVNSNGEADDIVKEPLKVKKPAKTKKTPLIKSAKQ